MQKKTSFTHKNDTESDWESRSTGYNESNRRRKKNGLRESKHNLRANRKRNYTDDFIY